MNSISIAIGIKALNEERHIRQSLESACSVASVVPYPVEIILADSGSTDLTLDIARQFPAVKIVQLAHVDERSCGAGAQAAFQASSSTYFYLLDGDMVLDPAFIVAGIAFLEGHPDFAGVGGMVREANTQSIEFAARARNDAVKGSAKAGDADRLDCGGLYRAQAIKEVGYFANRNLYAFEEFELAARLAARGWKLARIPIPAITHHGHTCASLPLIWRRIRSGYASGTGQVVKAAWGQPYLPVILRRFSHLRHAAIVVVWGLILFTSLVIAILTGQSRAFFLPAALLLLPLVFLSWRRHSFVFGLHSFATWLMHAVGLVQGLLRPQRNPHEPLALIVLQEPTK